MQHNQHGSLGMAAVVATLAFGCASSPAAPFNQMESSNLTAFRLQNYEPPAAAVQAQQTAGGVIPGLPPQIQQWIQQGAQGLQQLIPPGLLPPGLLPGQPGQAAAAAPAAVDTTPRFHNFRILGQIQVIDQSLKEELAEVLGDPDNFANNNANCMYAEMGLAFGGQAGTTNDVLISFSCNQVQGATFPWPHASGTGMKSDTVQKLAEVVQKLFPPGT